MKRVLVIFILTCVLALGFASMVNASSHVVYLENQSGVDFYGVYVKPSRSDNWGTNRLIGVFHDNQELAVTLYAYSPSWDLAVIDKAGAAYCFWDISLSDLDRFTITP